MSVNMSKVVDAKVLRICCMVLDEFTAHILDSKGDELGGQDRGYVPDFMPGDHYGDYLSLDIDLESGQVLNWNRPTTEQLAEFIENGSCE